jgi:hypothetical protein
VSSKWLVAIQKKLFFIIKKPPDASGGFSISGRKHLLLSE